MEAPKCKCGSAAKPQPVEPPGKISIQKQEREAWRLDKFELDTCGQAVALGWCGLNYYLEKMALCRLERSSSPCAGRRQFPQILSWDDATLELFMTNAGEPLAGAHGENKRHLPWSQYSVQFSCMQRQLALVNVVHHDLMAKQVLAKRDSRGAMQLTLADFDESSVDELSCPCTGSVHLTLTLTPTFALTLLY